MMKNLRGIFWGGAVVALGLAALVTGCRTGWGSKPVLLYSLYFNAPGENRYAPDGAYKEALTRLGNDFAVRVSDQPLTRESLADVRVVLIANPNDTAHGTNRAPHHVSAADVEALGGFVEAGGGLIVMSNQDKHNVETADANRLLARFGMRFENRYTDIKALVLPRSTPIIGGLKWGYYSGNLVATEAGHAARPRELVANDLSVKPLNGPRDEAGTLLAVAEPGRGRVVVVTDSGWITDGNLKGGANAVVKVHDNWEIFRRLVAWVGR